VTEPPLVRTLQGPMPLKEVGGKAYNLAALVAADLPVPRSVVVTRSAWQMFVDGVMVEGSQVVPVHTDDTAGARALAMSLRERFGSAAVPMQVKEQLRAVQQDVLGTRPVAVRSSAIIEDSQALSFAGQYESFLNLSTVQATAEAVRQCWLHAVSERVVEYQLTLKVGEIPSPMAVLVQELVSPRAAGVFFSRNPVTGDASTAWLTSNWGLATTVVDGTVQADNFILSQHDGTLLDVTIGDKQDREDAAREGGVTRTAVDPAWRTVPSITPDEVLEIWRMGKRAEGALGVPVDMEWAALHDSRIVVLQARPITTRRV
jgi:rifampicin phosphotransferase